MASDPNSIPKFPRALNSPIHMTGEPRILPSVITDFRNMDAVYASNVQDVGFQGPMPLYYPISDTGFTGLGHGGGVASTVWRPSIGSPVTYPESVSLATGNGCNINSGVQHKPNSTISRTSERSLDSFAENRIKFLCSYGGRILPRPSDGMLRYVGGQTRIISLQKDSTFAEFSQKMITTFGQPVVVKYQLPDEDLDALVSVSCSDDLENMLEEYYKLSERSSEGSSKLRLFLFPNSDRDSSPTSNFGDLQDDVGQQYVDAVNGIFDGVGSGFKRKGSIASIASTHNSDITASEAKYSTGSGKFDTNGSSLSSALSPKANIIPSDDNIPKALAADSSALGYNESPAIRQNISVGKITPQTVLSPSEHGPNKPILIPIPIQKQSGLENTPSPSHLSDFVNPCPGLALDPQISSSKGDPNLQPLGNTYAPSSAQSQSQISYSTPSHDNVTIVHSEVVPPYSGMNVAAIRPLMDLYPSENSYVPQIFQFPNNPNPNMYNPYIPSPFFAGGYGFHPVLPTGQVLPDGRFVQPRVIFPTKIQKYKDCLMCQKALPHAHSDTVAQDQRVNGVSSALDSIPSHHSLCTEDDTRNRHMNTDSPNGAPTEETLDPQVFKKTHDWAQNEVRSIPNMGVFVPNFQKSDNPDRFITSVPHGVMRMGGELQPTYGAWPSTIYQPHREDHRLQPIQGIGQFQVNQEPSFSNNVASAGVFPIVSNPPFATSEHNDISAKPPRIIPVDVAVGSSIKQGEKGINDGRDFRACDNIPVNKNPPFDKHKKEEFLDTRMQQSYGKEFLRDGTSAIPLTSHYPNQGITPEFLPPLDTHYVQNMRAGEISEAEQYHFMGSNTVNHPMAFDEVINGSSTNYGIDSPGITNQAPQLQQNIIPIKPKPTPLNVTTSIIPTSITTSSKPGDFQDRPSVDDPWNFRHVVSSIPYNISKSPTKDEVSCSSDAIVDQNAIHMNNLRPDLLLKDDKGQEEIISYENQMVSSGVTTSVHPPTTSSPLNICVPDQDTSNLDHKRYSEDPEYDADKFEDLKAKNPEKSSFGFPVSDDIGHLQIIKNIDLEELCELGSGTFGTVYHGKWRGTDVAIKRINDRFFSGKQSEQERMRDDFWNEAIKLADLHHPNVVAFYGVVLDGPGDSVATVTEYMVNGSLRNNLQKNEKILDRRKRLLISMDVAFGMEYLHGKNIVHFDLKSDNLLVNLRDPHRPICKVGDLGLSKVKCRTLISGGVRGTLPWMAPELLNGSSSLVSEKVDVFSFGIVMWELLTGDEPYADLHYGAIIGGIVSNTLRPAVPETCEAEWRCLMERCWSTEPFERPSFTEIASELRSMSAVKITSPKCGGPLQHHHPPLLPK